MSDFAERVAAQRPILLRTAHQLLRNKAWAEDAVSETLVAALEKPKDTGEIRDELGVTANNLCVILHRANRPLRASFQEANHGFR
jgi:Sigma-70 region 2